MFHVKHFGAIRAATQGVQNPSNIHGACALGDNQRRRISFRESAKKRLPMAARIAA
jgi:hypothetical protein